MQEEMPGRIHYRQSDSDFRRQRTGWLLLTIFIFGLNTLILYPLLLLIGEGKSSAGLLLLVLLLPLVMVGTLSFYRYLKDRPMAIASDGIHFSSTYDEPLPLFRIKALGWLGGRKSGDPHQFLFIVTDDILYIVGKPLSRHVSQVVDDIEEVADVLSLQTGKRVLTADANWLKPDWRKEQAW